MQQNARNTISPRLAAAAGVVVILSFALGACTTERMGSLHAFGHWAEQDTRAFVADIENAPAWITNSVKSQSQDFGAAVGFAVRKTAQDVEATRHNIAGAPAYIAHQESRDFKSLSATTSDAGGWIAKDAKSFSDDIFGSPAFISKHAARETHDLFDYLKEVWRQFRDDVRTFPARIAETISVMFIK